MTEIIAEPFDWNDNLSKEALEDFETIQKDLSYCSCQNIGMALAKLELLEKQGCKVIKPQAEGSHKSCKTCKYTYDICTPKYDDMRCWTPKLSKSEGGDQE